MLVIMIHILCILIIFRNNLKYIELIKCFIRSQQSKLYRNFALRLTGTEAGLWSRHIYLNRGSWPYKKNRKQGNLAAVVARIEIPSKQKYERSRKSASYRRLFYRWLSGELIGRFATGASKRSMFFFTDCIVGMKSIRIFIYIDL